ncbi:Bromo domain protein, partial [Gryllus bimaculatus]
MGVPFEIKVFLRSEEPAVVRKCYPAMRHAEGDVIARHDCVLLKSGPRRTDLPFVAKVAALWENPDDGE